MNHASTRMEKITITLVVFQISGADASVGPTKLGITTFHDNYNHERVYVVQGIKILAF